MPKIFKHWPGSPIRRKKIPKDAFPSELTVMSSESDRMSRRKGNSLEHDGPISDSDFILACDSNVSDSEGYCEADGLTSASEDICLHSAKSPLSVTSDLETMEFQSARLRRFSRLSVLDPNKLSVHSDVLRRLSYEGGYSSDSELSSDPIRMMRRNGLVSDDESLAINLERLQKLARKQGIKFDSPVGCIL
jgi:hypothetical protein